MGLTSTNRKICDDPWRVSLSRRASTLHHLSSHINTSSNKKNYHNRFDCIIWSDLSVDEMIDALLALLNEPISIEIERRQELLIQSTRDYYAQRKHDAIREEPPGDTYADFLVFLSQSAEREETIPTEIVIHKEDDVDGMVVRRRTSLSCQSSTIDDWNMDTRLPTGYVWI